MNLRLIVLIGAVLTTLAIGFSQPETHEGPVFTQDGSLVLPTGFREWVSLADRLLPTG